jgi:hypothetical protein
VTIPTSLGFSLSKPNFNDIGVNVVGLEKGQNMYNSAMDYGKKFYQQGYDVSLGKYSVDQFKNMTPLEAINSEINKFNSYQETIAGQLHIRKMADKYKRVGEMQLEQYKILFKKYKSQVTNLNIRKIGNKALKIVSKVKFLAK